MTETRSSRSETSSIEHHTSGIIIDENDDLELLQRLTKLE